MANTNDKIYLTIDSSGVNKDGPGRFRTMADNPEFQVYYFNSKKDKTGLQRVYQPKNK